MRKPELATGPRRLPVVLYGNTEYFADLRLGEFRETKNPCQYVKFTSELGRLMCQQTGILHCSQCGMSVIVSKVFENKSLQCMQCQNKIEAFLEGQY